MMEDTAHLFAVAQECSNMEHRKLLRDALTAIRLAESAFHESLSAVDLRTLNGAWAHAERVFKATPPEGAPAPLSDDNAPARLAA